MNTDINLLGGKESQQGNVFSTLIKRVAIFLLVIVVLLSVVFFILKSGSQLSNLQAEEGELITQLSKFNVKIAKYLFIDDRLKSSQTIVAKRPNFDKSITLLKKDIPVTISLDSLSLSQHEFSLTLSSVGISGMHEYLEKVQNELSKDPMVTSLTIDNVSYDNKNNRYSVTIFGELQ